MLNGEIRELIREVLREELGRTGGAGPGPVREERVRIGSDADLNAFALRMLDLARDAGASREIREGRHVFRLSGAATSPGRSAAQAAAEFAPGLISERQVHALPDDTRSVRAGRGVRFTPLALDELRRRGIKLERVKR